MLKLFENNLLHKYFPCLLDFDLYKLEKLDAPQETNKFDWPNKIKNKMNRKEGIRSGKYIP